jgi:hypothetical protein
MDLGHRARSFRFLTFALEPNYAFGRHLAYLGGTVVVGEDEALELNPYTARTLRAGETA